MIRHRWLPLLVLALFAPSLFAAGGQVLPPDHPFIGALADSKVERGREHRALLVVPIARELGDPAGGPKCPMTAAFAAKKEYLSAGEPENQPGRGPIELFNWSTDRIFILAGELFEGGLRDRFVSRDVLLEPGKKALAPAYFADRKPRLKAEALATLTPVGAIAPDLLRLVGLLEGSRAAADSFLQDEFALAGEKHPRETLLFILKSAKIKERMDEYRTMFAKIPAEAEGKAVGAAVLVGDRLVGVDLFGTNDLFAANWPALLHTYAFQAALYEVSYGLLAQPFPAARDPERFRANIKEFLKKPFAARAVKVPAVSLGQELRFQQGNVLGRVLIDGDRLIHAVLSLDLLTATADVPSPPNAGTTDPGVGELERRAGRARLTEYERRLLERMRNRRAGIPGRSEPLGPGGAGR
jgi:ARG and Rhodanese-Phosphatase-superfamily-associated Protein domain